MVKDYIVNAAIFVSFISLLNQILILKNADLNSSSRGLKILYGGIYGLLGIALMVFGVKLPNEMILDFRNLAVFLSAISGGYVSAIITTLIVSFARLLFYGINKPSITAIIVLIIITTIYCIIVNLKLRKNQKWIFSIGLSQVVTILAFKFLIKDNLLFQNITMVYCLSITAISFILYWYSGYLDTLTESYRRYKQESHKDFLTGLNNVRQFDKLFNRKIESVADNDEKIALLYIDIDYFKKVNDTYGHKEGDLVLKVLGEILIKTCRSIDFVSRNGGEEFSVILTNCDKGMALEIGERIRKNVEATSIELSDGTKINITVSVGVACYPEPIEEVRMLREKADIALYEAKRTGRNRVTFYNN